MADEPFNLRVNRDRFVPLASLTVLLALLMASLLGVSRVNGHYALIVSPFYAFVPVLALAYATVVFGRCRNGYLAVGLAVLVASLTYWGQFPAALVDEVGPQALLSPRVVVQYVALRMNSEAMVPTPLGPEQPAARGGRPHAEPALNWLFGFGEWGGMLLASTALLLIRSRVAFCERCGWWITTEKIALLPKSGSKIREMFEGGTLEQLKLFAKGELNPVTQRGVRSAAFSPAAVSVDFCRRTWDPGDHCPVYFTVFDSTAPRPSRVPLREGTKPLPDKPTYDKMPWWLLRVPLDDKQIEAVADVFPKLAAVMGKTPAQPQVAEEKESQADRTHPLAVIEKVPAGLPGEHFGWRRWLIRWTLQMTPIALLVGMPLVCLGVFLLNDAGNRDERWWMSLGRASCAVDLVVIVAIAVCAILCGGHVESLWLRRTFRKILRARRDRWIDPSSNSPGGDLVFVDVVRVIDRMRSLSESVTDTGFLQFDADHRQLVFEGDSERFSIPAAAIRFCQIETFGGGITSLLDWSLRKHDLVVVRAATAAGVWQAWFWCRNVWLRPVGRRGRREAAERLASRIVALTNNVVEPPADATDEDLAYVQSHPPRCLAAFQTSTATRKEGLDGHGEPVNSFFDVCCPCGSTEHQVLGYPLVHPESRELVFVGPLALRCKKCRRASEMFDAKQHGYNAEHGSATTTLCGEGERTAFQCAYCHAANFGLVARFEYSSEGLYDDDECRIDRAEDYFTWFTLLGRCAGCSKEAHIADFECA